MKTLKITLPLVVLLCFGSFSSFAKDPMVYLRLVPPHFTNLENVKLTIVESRDESASAWVKRGTYPNFMMTICVGDLIEGHKYRFRVILVSVSGPGRPSQPTELIEATSEFSPEIGVFCEEPHRPLRSNYVMLESRETDISVLPSFYTVEETKIPFRQ